MSVTAEIDISNLDKAEAMIMDKLTKELSRAGSQIYNSLVAALTGKQNKIL